MVAPRRRVALALALVALGPGRALAQGSSKQECATAYEQAQEMRSSGKLLNAREALVLCAQEVCPAFVQSDCAQWVTEVERELPTIVIAAKDKNGDDTTAVRVTVDEVLFAPELGGKALAIDPGPHKFRFELEGADPIEKQIVIRQGQKDRAIEVSFAPPEADPLESSPYGAAAAGAEPEKDEADAAGGQPGPLRTWAYVAGGVGVAGLAGWVVLGLMGKAEQSDLENSGCKPNCRQADVDSIDTKYLMADISLAVGVVGLGTGVALWLVSQPRSGSGDDGASAESAAVRWGVAPARGGALGVVQGDF